MVLETKKGYSLAAGNTMYFLETEKETKCKSVIDEMIKGICDYKTKTHGISWEETKKRALSDKATREDMAYRIQKTKYELRETDEKHMRYINLSGKNFGGGYDIDEVVMI